jgi:cell division protein FtsQ
MSNVEDTTAEPPGRSWRNIRQDVSAPAMSATGRRRQLYAWVKLGAIGSFVAAAGWGTYVVVHSWETDRAALATAVHSEPVRDILLKTDGVLDQKWVAATLALPKTASLMSLDLPALRDRLLQSGQVRVAVLGRNFPDALVVTVQERTPVARIQADDGGGRPKQLVVARDGVVYDGLNYDSKMLATLPFLAGVRLVRNGANLAPIAGMADVSALLTMAQLQAPNLYREWEIVSLAHLADRDEIVVKAQDIPEIIFTRKRDYFKQLAQLDYVVDAAHTQAEPALQSVNLSLDGQVTARLTSTPDELQQAAAQPAFQLNNSPRKAKRDL